MYIAYIEAGNVNFGINDYKITRPEYSSGRAEPQHPAPITGDGGSGRGEAHTVGNYHSELDFAGR